MQELTDRDIAYDLLYGAKGSALAYMEATIESASPRCRETFHRLHDDCLQDQWKLFQMLHRRNEYRVDQVSQSEVATVHQHMAHLRRTHEGREQNAGGGRWEDRGWNEPTYAGGNGYRGSDVNFEPDRGLPRGTRFEAERGNRYETPADGSRWASSVAGTAETGSSTYGGTGGRGSWAASNATATPDWQDRGRGVSPGAMSRSGEGTWQPDEARRPQTSSTHRY